MKVQLKSTDGTENLYPVTAANSVIFPDGNNLEAKFPELVGKSAYQSWLDAGHTGTESDFLEWLKGVGFQSVSSQQDGTIVITLTSGDTVTIDLNHVHPQYISKAAETAQPSGGFKPDVVYKLGTLTGTVTFSLAAAVTGNVNHYFWSFDTGSTAPTVTFPSGITWADSAPTVAASKHYEISILGGIATYLEV